MKMTRRKRGRGTKKNPCRRWGKRERQYWPRDQVRRGWYRGQREICSRTSLPLHGPTGHRFEARLAGKRKARWIRVRKRGTRKEGLKRVGRQTETMKEERGKEEAKRDSD